LRAAAAAHGLCSQVAMPDLLTDWELVSRKATTSSHGFLDRLRGLFSSAVADGQPIIWTVRHRATGLVRRLTARTELEARVKIANGLFDAA
jgi:hypothetical protein